MPERVKGKTLLFILIIIAAAPLYFWSALDGSTLLTERDLSVFFIPPRVFWTEALMSGEFPLWNPYSFAGHPLFATLQPGVLYPVNALFLLFPFDIAFNWSIVVHYALAGSFTYALLKELRASCSGALAGGLVFMLSGYLFSVHNVMSTLFSVTWAPLALLAQIRALRSGSPVYAAVCGLVMCVMLMGGGIETVGAAFMLIIIVCFCPSVLLEDWSGRPGVMSRAGLLAVAIIAFLGLSAIQLIPFLELAFQSTRAGGLSYSEATTWSFGFKDFIQLILPDPYGYGTSSEKYWTNQSWLKTVYLGPVPIMLTGFYLLKRRAKALPSALTALFFVALAMGSNTPLYRYFFEYFPFADKFRYPVKLLFVPFLLISLSAGQGLDSIKEAIRQKDGRALKAIAAALSVAFFSAVLLGGLDLFESSIKERLVLSGLDYPEYNVSSINIFNAKRSLMFIMLASGAIYAALRFRSAALASALLIPILGADLFFAHNGYYESSDSADYHSKSPVLEFINNDNSELFRVYTTPKTMKQQSITAPVEKGALLKAEKEKVSGFSLEHRVFDVGGVEVMRRGDYSAIQELIARQNGPDATALLKMLNVKYIVSLPRIESEAWKRVDFTSPVNKDSFKVYENKDFLPRHYMVYDYELLTDTEDALKTLVDEFEPARTVLLEKEPAGIKRQFSGKSSVKVASYSSNETVLRVKTDTDGVLVASESWYPGWKAYVDGEEVELMRANIVLRAVALKAGEHTVRFVYSPASFKAGVLISASTLVLATAMTAYSVKRNKA